MSLVTLGCRPSSPDEPAISAPLLQAPSAQATLATPSTTQSAQGLTIPVGMIWLSHILIRHAESGRSVPFAPSEWHFTSPNPSRSKVEGRRHATELAREAQRRPERFAELARLHSDDDFSRDLGGTLGGMVETQFRPWQEVSRGIAGLTPGQVSGVLETPAGFHVFYREYSPAAETVSGSRIVIGYDDATWLRKIVPRPGRAVGQRSRAEALALATFLYDQLSTQPEQFDRLVSEYSEHSDALRGGDVGQWSTIEPCPLSKEMRILQRLGVGEIYTPLDTMIGFQILKRTRISARERFAMSAIQLRFDPTQPRQTASSKASVAARAVAIAQEVSSNPSRFAALQEELCCTTTETWVAGRGRPALEKALERLEVGQVADQPVEAGVWHFIPKRLAP